MISDIGMNEIQIWLNVKMHIYVGLDMYVYEDMETYLVVTVCFCYRSRGRSQGAGQAELAVEHIPWETCTLS